MSKQCMIQENFPNFLKFPRISLGTVEETQETAAAFSFPSLLIIGDPLTYLSCAGSSRLLTQTHNVC